MKASEEEAWEKILDIEKEDGMTEDTTDDETFFEIDSNYARLVIDGKETAKVDAKSFTTALYGNDIGMLPPAVRWISDSAPWVLLLERPPRFVSILTGDDSEIKLHLPWTLWLMQVSTSRELSVNVYARPDALYSFNESLFHLPLPGIDDTGAVTDFDYTLDNTEAIGYQLPEAIDAVLRHVGSLINDEDEPAHIPEGWPDENIAKMLSYWANLGQVEVADTRFREVEDMTVGELTQRKTKQPDTVFELVKSITEHIKEQA